MEIDRILLVEDNFLLNQDLSQSLQEIGYAVKPVCCDQTAFETIDRREHFLAPVADINLGYGPDGGDVARYARAFYSHLPVLFISDRADGRHAGHGVARSEFIPKPFQAGQIAAALDRLICLEAA